MQIHRLKTKYRFYDRVIAGGKKAEIRKLDRDYKVGDYLILDRIFQGAVSHTTVAEITDILTYEDFQDGLKEGFGMLSIRLIDNPGYKHAILTLAENEANTVPPPVVANDGEIAKLKERDKRKRETHGT